MGVQAFVDLRGHWRSNTCGGGRVGACAPDKQRASFPRIAMSNKVAVSNGSET